MITVEQIQYILELSKTQSFHKTAENLYISQPAVSKAVKRAEEDLQVKLFERTPTGVYLTKAGQEIVKVIDEIANHFNEIYLMTNYFSYYQQEHRIESVQVYCHNSIGNYVLPHIATDLHGYIKDLNLQVVEILAKEAIGKVKSDSNGIGIGVFHPDEIEKLEDDFRVARICQAEPYLVANKGMMPLNLDEGEIVSIEKLSEYPLVLNQFQPPLTRSFLDQMKARGIEPKIIMRSPTAAIFTKYVTDGLACGIVTKLGHFYMFPPSLKDIAYFPIESNDQFEFLLYANKEFPEQLYQLFYHLLYRLLMLK